MSTYKWRVRVRNGFDDLVEETEWSVLSTTERAYERLKKDYEDRPEFRVILESRD